MKSCNDPMHSLLGTCLSCLCIGRGAFSSSVRLNSSYSQPAGSQPLLEATRLSQSQSVGARSGSEGSRINAPCTFDIAAGGNADPS